MSQQNFNIEILKQFRFNPARTIRSVFLGAALRCRNTAPAITDKYGSFTAVKVPFCDYGPKTHCKRIRFDRPVKSGSKGQLECPSENCTFEIQPSGLDDEFIDADKQSMWDRMAVTHPDEFQSLLDQYRLVKYIPRKEKVDKAFELVGLSYAKMNKILSSFSTTEINGQEALQKIIEEQKRIQKQLGELLVGSSTSTQQQTTTSTLPSL